MNGTDEAAVNPAAPDRSRPGSPGTGVAVRCRVGAGLGGVLLVLAVLVRVGSRPGLWSTALRQLARTTGPSWWRRPPFLPLPARRYAAFRLQTMYGGDGRLGEIVRRRDAWRVAEDLVGWLAWTAREHAATRPGRGWRVGQRSVRRRRR